MKFYSTNHSAENLEFDAAVLKGLASDNGVYFPESIPALPNSFFEQIKSKTKEEIAYTVLSPFLNNVFDENTIKKIIEETINFDFPLVPVEQGIYAMELFHGPTLAFKDVGARFLARCLSYCRPKNGKVKVLVATSGDTGSAVAQGFLNVDGIEVIILYPSGKISHSQEQQLTTNGANITALEVEGDFDDCQHLVKSAFADQSLNDAMFLTSANSINIARLLPQSLYYYFAYQQLASQDKPLVVSVPSGNYGNLTAGLLAKEMGLPIQCFVASANSNDAVPQYLSSGNYQPKASVATISNAMDVGAPNNFPRMLALHKSHAAMSEVVKGYSFTDAATTKAMKDTYTTTGYILDPHGAVGYLGLKKFIQEHPEYQGIFLETAHPAKFKDIVEKAIGVSIEVPERLQAYLNKTKHAIAMPASFEAFKTFLLKQKETV